MAKDEEPRSLLRKRGYGLFELCYNNYSDNKRDQLCNEVRNSLAKMAC